MPIPQQSKFAEAVGHLMPKVSKKRSSILWKGPDSTEEQGGITFSLLSRYLSDKERFRIYVIEGLCPQEGWNHRLGYGNMWHICEEALAGTYAHDPKMVAPHKAEWEMPLSDYVRKECQTHKTQQETIDKWYHVCKAQFPAYIEHWRKHPDVKKREPIYQEYPFSVLYRLPSGRFIRLRGKWDSVDRVGNEIWLQENKTKGDVKPLQLQRQLTFDLQTMLYLVAFLHSEEIGSIAGKVEGVRYNVIRRPLSGGKHSIVQHKPSKKEPMGESKEHYYARLAGLIQDNPDDFFWRWNVHVSSGEVKKFQRECLDPILENLLDDYEWWRYCKLGTGDNDPFNGEQRRKLFPEHCPRHFRYPFGVFNILDEGGSSDLDEYLSSGSEVGLRRIDNLFPELTG